MTNSENDREQVCVNMPWNLDHLDMHNSLPVDNDPTNAGAAVTN